MGAFRLYILEPHHQREVVAEAGTVVVVLEGAEWTLAAILGLVLKEEGGIVDIGGVYPII